MNAYTLAAIPPTLLLIVKPELWPWALAVAALLVIIGLGLAAHESRTERDDARAELDRLARELAAAEETVADLEAAFAEVRQALSDGRVVMPLKPTSVVPMSREVSDYDWPAIARVLDIETGDGA